MDVFRSKGNIALITTMDVLITDLKNQQLKAMTGNTEGRVTNDAYGVYFDQINNKYVLFHGPNYDSNETTNFPVKLNEGDQFSQINLPNSQIVFASASGEVEPFDPNNNLVIENTNSRSVKTIKFNKFGVIESIN